MSFPEQATFPKCCKTHPPYLLDLPVAIAPPPHPGCWTGCRTVLVQMDTVLGTSPQGQPKCNCRSVTWRCRGLRFSLDMSSASASLPHPLVFLAQPAQPSPALRRALAAGAGKSMAEPRTIEALPGCCTDPLLAQDSPSFCLSPSYCFLSGSCVVLLALLSSLCQTPGWPRKSLHPLPLGGTFP